MGKQNFICVVLTFATALHVETQTIHETEILFNNLTSGYNKMIRPAADQRNAVDVDIHYDVMGIQGVDEIKGEITVNFFLTLWWKDHRLSWVPGDNNNLRSIMMEHGTVWKPELRLMNPATPVTSQEFSWPHVRYSYDGGARWAPNGFYEVSCSIDIKYYPMDVQTCIVRFQVWDWLHDRFSAFCFQIYLFPRGRVVNSVIFRYSIISPLSLVWVRAPHGTHVRQAKFYLRV